MRKNLDPKEIPGGQESVHAAYAETGNQKDADRYQNVKSDVENL